MTHSTDVKPASATQFCSTCTHFNNFHESNGRGWCGLFDHYAKEHHPQTQDCVLSSEPVQRQEGADRRKTTRGHSPSRHELEDNLDAFSGVDFDSVATSTQLEQPEYKVGSVVKIIDKDEDCEEWATFEVSEVRHNELLHDDIESYLRGSQWYYHLVSNSDSKSFSLSIWVAQKEICRFDQSHLFCAHNPQPTDTPAQLAKPKPVLNFKSSSKTKKDFYTVLRTWDNGSVYMGSPVESVLIKSTTGNTKPSWETVIKSQGIVTGDILTRGRDCYLVKASQSVAA